MNSQTLTDTTLVKVTKELIIACDQFLNDPSLVNQLAYEAAVRRLADIQSQQTSKPASKVQVALTRSELHSYVTQYETDRGLDIDTAGTLGILVQNAWSFGNSSVDSMDSRTEDALDEYIHLSQIEE